MSRTTLGVVGVLITVMGILALIPNWRWMTQPAWYSWVWIVVGVIALIIAVSDSEK